MNWACCDELPAILHIDVGIVRNVQLNGETVQEFAQLIEDNNIDKRWSLDWIHNCNPIYLIHMVIE